MGDREFISQRKLLGFKSDGEKVDIVVGVGIPYQDEKFDSWVCPVKIEGLYGELAGTHGIDSWQALRLAQKTVVSLLTSFIEKGGKLFLFDEDGAITKDEVEEFF